MKRSAVLIGMFLLLFGVSTVANATTILYSTTAVGDEFVSPYVATTWDFNNGVLPVGWVGNAAVGSGSTSGYAAAPAGLSGIPDASKFVVVPGNGASGTVTVTGFTPAPSNYFGIWWGSIDTYNTLTFYNGNTQVAQFTGSDISTAPNGSWTESQANKYVNFLDLPNFDKFEMTSSQIAFEADNIAVGNVAVPEPFTMLFLSSALVGVAGLGRKFKK